MVPSDPSRDPERSRDDSDGVISPLRFLSGGVEFAVTCAAGALLGQWIDGRLGTAPWFTIVLLVVAFATGTWLLLRGLSVIDSDATSDDGDRDG